MGKKKPNKGRSNRKQPKTENKEVNKKTPLAETPVQPAPIEVEQEPQSPLQAASQSQEEASESALVTLAQPADAATIVTAPPSLPSAQGSTEPAAATVSAKAQTIDDMIAAYDKYAKDNGKYKEGFAAPKQLPDGRLQVQFPGPKEAKEFFQQQAEAKNPFIVSNDKGEVIAYSNGDGKLYDSERNEVAEGTSFDQLKPGNPPVKYDEFPLSKEAKGIDGPATSNEQADDESSSPTPT